MRCNKLQKLLIIVVGLLILLNLSGCATAPPKNVENVCRIFNEYPKWYWAAQDVQKKWGVPMSVLMAIMYQESRFRSDAKPPRTKLLWVIPWTRPTSAYGYSQATNESWYLYQRKTSNYRADRDEFSDAANFIGWYATVAKQRAGISKRDPYRLYLAYHEGITGYIKGSYWHKKWLIGIAKKVQQRSLTFHCQLLGCANSLPSRPWWHPWSY